MRIRILLLSTIMALLCLPAHAQMERERAVTDPAVEEIFWTHGLVATGTVQQVPAGNLNVTIMHSFGVLSNRTLQNFFGLDSPPNVRLGLDFGLTDGWSVGIGRTTFEKVVDLRTQLVLLRQGAGGAPPLSLSLKGDLGVSTVENRRPLSDDLSGTASLMAARRFGEAFSLQLSPMVSWFASPLPGNDGTLAGVGVGAEYRMSDRYALFAEWLPVIGNRFEGAHNAFSVGLDIETGGHVFQLFFSNTQWHTEQYAISHTNTDFWAGDFRFGFNVNRIFQL